jgi:hypothetical protein
MPNPRTLRGPEAKRLEAVCGGASRLGAYQQYELDGMRNLRVYAPQDAFTGVYGIGPSSATAENIAEQAAAHYFQQNGGHSVGVDVLRTDDQGRVVATYGTLQIAPPDGTSAWTPDPGEARPFLQGPAQAVREFNARAENYMDEANVQRQALIDANDPNNEGYEYFAAQARADEAYQQLDVMGRSYVAVRDTPPPLDTQTITPFEYRTDDVTGGTGGTGETRDVAVPTATESTEPEYYEGDYSE